MKWSPRKLYVLMSYSGHVLKRSAALFRTVQDRKWKRENLCEEGGSKGSKGFKPVDRSGPKPETAYNPRGKDSTMLPQRISGLSQTDDCPFSPILLFHYFMLNIWRQIIYLLISQDPRPRGITSVLLEKLWMSLRDAKQ